jgi:hypothetical protein
MRASISASIKTAVIKDMYHQIFCILTEGQRANSSGKPDGVPLITMDVGNAENKKVKYPTQKINELALSLAKSVDEFLSDIVDIVCPAEYLDVVKESFITKSKANLTNV